MEIVITSTGNSLSSKLDLRFGRAAWFCVYNIETNESSFIENENKDAKGGAGTKTAEKMAEIGAKRIVSGDFGPKAKALLDRFNIEMVILDDSSKSIEDIIKKLRN